MSRRHNGTRKAAGKRERPVVPDHDVQAPHHDPRVDPSPRPDAPSPGPRDPHGAPKWLDVAPPPLQNGERPEQGALDRVDGGADGNGDGLPVLTVRSTLATGDGRVATERAADLALPKVSGTPESVLKAMGGAMLAVALQGINVLKHVMERCETHDDVVGTIASAKALNDSTYKWYEHAHGKKVSLGVAVRSQEDLPRWESLAPDVREAVEQALAQLGDPSRDD